MADTETIIQDVAAFYRNFIDGFNQEDTDLYLRSFCYPNAILSGEQGMIVHTKESDQQRFYQEVMVSIQSLGWDHTEVDRIEVWPLSETMAAGSADIVRYKADGSQLEQGRYFYTFRRDGGVWKILTLTEVKPPFTGPARSS